MALNLTNNERVRLALEGLKLAPRSPEYCGPHFVEAVWAGRNEKGVAYIRGWLHVMAFEADGGVLAVVVDHGPWNPKIRGVPDEEVVWLLRGPYPPGAEAKVPRREPILDLPGESLAYCLRRVLGIPPLAMVPPTSMIYRQPEFCVARRARSPDGTQMLTGFNILKTKLQFIVEYEYLQKPREASAGLSLAWWYVALFGSGVHVFDWEDLPGLLDSSNARFTLLIDTYQALRLPGLLLALEYRASPLGLRSFVRDLADRYQLPVPLVSRRLGVLHQHAETLALN